MIQFGRVGSLILGITATVGTVTIVKAVINIVKTKK